MAEWGWDLLKLDDRNIIEGKRARKKLRVDPPTVPKVRRITGAAPRVQLRVGDQVTLPVDHFGTNWAQWTFRGQNWRTVRNVGVVEELKSERTMVCWRGDGELKSLVPVTQLAIPPMPLPDTVIYARIDGQPVQPTPEEPPEEQAQLEAADPTDITRAQRWLQGG